MKFLRNNMFKIYESKKTGQNKTVNREQKTKHDKTIIRTFVGRRTLGNCSHETRQRLPQSKRLISTGTSTLNASY